MLFQYCPVSVILNVKLFISYDFIGIKYLILQMPTDKCLVDKYKYLMVIFTSLMVGNNICGDY